MLHSLGADRDSTQTSLLQSWESCWLHVNMHGLPEARSMAGQILAKSFEQPIQHPRQAQGLYCHASRRTDTAVSRHELTC